MNLTTTIVLGTGLILVGCDQLPMGKSKIQCNDENSKTLVKEIVVEQLQHKTSASVKELIASGGQAVDMAQLRNTITQLEMNVADVRTSKEDPQSSKKFCEAVLSVSLPASFIQQANQSRTFYNLPDIQQLAILNGLNLENSVLSYDVSYAVQPTDDGKKVYATLDNAQPVIDYLSTVTLDVLQKNVRQNEYTLAVQQQQEQAQQEAAEASEQARVQTEYLQLQQAEAKQKLDVANNKLNLVWKAARKDVRDELLAEQRLWLKKRDLECRLKAQDAEPGYAEVERLACETEMTNTRNSELRSAIAELEAYAPE
ncbi:lysozyme inhibitor LprI family protein [Acinetobacter sp. CAAS 2-6]|uniref:lysozyme inhibitor LprI family protein n=1 Tax=Acinetobacter sp. CAAS 2-6 TaxID=3016358 RepID=UPI002DD6A0D1|nr:lysozyme inhibitor LprI family protein [Acinetobacter sp. CAAS 2-6]